MNEMRKLMEAVTLLEYLMREGDSIKSLLRLNIFGDTGHIEGGIVYGPDDVSWEEGELDPGLQREWLRNVKPYAKKAGQLKKAIIKADSKGRTLTSAEVNAAENTWYDGSDLYGDLELAFDELPEVWDNQLEVVFAILAGEIEDDEGDYAAFGEAYQGGKTEHSGAKKGKGAFYGRKKEAKRDSNKNRRRAGKEASLGEAEDDYKTLGKGGYAAAHQNDTPGAKKYTRQYGNVTVDFDGDEVLITHGYGENIFLTMEEWKEFAGEIQDILI